MGMAGLAGLARFGQNVQVGRHGGTPFIVPNQVAVRAPDAILTEFCTSFLPDPQTLKNKPTK